MHMRKCRRIPFYIYKKRVNSNVHAYGTVFSPILNLFHRRGKFLEFPFATTVIVATDYG